jgi:hypothetical protein
MLSNPQVPELLGKLETGSELNATENVSLDIIARRFLVYWWDVEAAFDRKLLDAVIFDTNCNDAKRIINRYPKMGLLMREIMDEYDLLVNLKIMAPLYRLPNNPT